MFTDGRDSPPHSSITFLKELRKHLQPHEKIASISGRLYAMDRNKNWGRTEKAYHSIVCGTANYSAASAEDAIAQAYNRGESDEYIQPTLIESDIKYRGIQNGDGIYFFNARSDRARQLTKALVQTNTFEEHNMGAFHRACILTDIHFVAMSEFGPDLPGILTAFPSPDIPNCLAQAIGEDRKQLYISETEKYAHVTFFLNGGYPEPINGEDRYLIKSKDVPNFAEYPEMESVAITESVLQAMNQDQYTFICVNYPNADMVGHTGNVDAAKKAVWAVDQAISRLVQSVLQKKGTVIITADHGNAEDMLNEKTGEMVTEHSINPVPFILINDALKQKELRSGGTLQDVAPTLLDVLQILLPDDMTGKSLLERPLDLI